MIRIEKDKIIYEDNSNRAHEIMPAEIPVHLGDVVELGEFVTFARVFELIIDNKAFFNTIFAKDLGHHTIEQYMEEYNKPTLHSKDSYDLEVHIVCDVYDYVDDRHFEYYTGFHGFGVLEGDLESEKPYPISLSFTPLNELKNKYIRLNKQVQIHVYPGGADLERREVYDAEIRLFDFFAAILDEISFFGDPQSRTRAADEIGKTAKAVESGEENLLPMEEVKEQWEKELAESEQEEERVRLERVKEKVSSGYLTHFIESTFQETVKKLEILEKDLVRLERYEDAKLVRADIEKLNK